MWINCNIYNKKGDYVQKLGARAETLFSQEWARSGLSGGAPRAKRTNAGVAAEKYEPPHIPLMPEKKRTLSGGPKTTSKVAPTRSRQGRVRMTCHVSYVASCQVMRGCFSHEGLFFSRLCSSSSSMCTQIATTSQLDCLIYQAYICCNVFNCTDASRPTGWRCVGPCVGQ